ncbi:peroxidase [Shimia sp. R9_2]|uniref:peroxidase family protein n=1 Tax=Shimia sp. R9_2 TaxID=2821112 RepID=UPI001ADC84A3|nr:heme peroxidase family protein [Shimia sp. R9_2]MBO9398514.1 peroxidase [Shimia sp. R9_2]
MIIIKGHGGQVSGNGRGGANTQQSMNAACGYVEGEDYPDTASAAFGPFGYFFPNADSTHPRPEIAEALDRLGVAMVDTVSPEADNSEMPALFTYLGQFIDHDITAGTDRETDFSVIDVANASLGQHEKSLVETKVVNLRTGALDLDSVYGGAVHTGSFGKRLQNAMRFPSDRAKMLLGTSFDIPGCRPDLPNDIATDLLRLQRVIDPDRTIIPSSEFEALTGDLAERFLDEDGKPIPARAIIGDMRNDENLAVAQTHLMFLRLHNKIVDSATPNDVNLGDREAVFEWARQQTRRIYQWLLMNVYLPTICDRDTVNDVVAQGAPVYRSFMDPIGDSGARLMPLPLEFSVAAFRFGHTQARSDYDWNFIFGRGDTDCNPSSDRAGFNLLFGFTGEGAPPMLGVANQLPSNWIVDMERLLNLGDVSHDDRNTRRIDTFIAPDLHEMKHMREGDNANMQNLPIRNLRRGHLLNVPTAQASIAGFAEHGIGITPLSAEEIASGPTGDAIRAGGFEDATPLWFYILKEAELMSNGRHLGPLGSRIVAETLAGLVIHGSGTYWHLSGSDNGRWHPRDGAHPDGVVVDSLPAMIQAVGYL